MKACFMGLGYIGLPTSIIAAENGVEVTGVDINPSVVEMTNAGKLHIVEPGLQELLERVVKSGNLRASLVPEESDAYFIVVPTPFKGNHEPDISYVEAATKAVIPLLKAGDLFVIESTSPVGTTGENVFAHFLMPSRTRRKNIHSVLSGACASRQCHLRTGAQRPCDRRYRPSVNGKSRRILFAVCKG